MSSRTAPAPFGSFGPPSAVLGMGMETSPRMEIRPSAVLVASMQLLGLSSMELELAIDRELSGNAALERVDDSSCPGCGGAFPSRCPLCAEGRATARTMGAPMADELVSEPPNRRSERDRLLDDVRALVEGEDRFVAEYLIGSLDDRGLLDESTEEIARRLDVAPDRVRRVLAATREISPPGLGARSVVECLLLQLDRLEIEGVSVPRHCRTIVEHHLDALASGRLGLIAKNLETTDASILEVRAFIRDHLRPYVAWQAPDGPGEDPPPTPLVLPDVLIVERPSAPGEYEVEVVEATRLALRIDPTYAAMMKRIEDRARSGPAGDARAEPAGARHEVSSLSPHERRHVQTEVRRARFFLSRLRDRWETLLRVTTYVAERQRGFLREGPAALEPMTRAEVAAALGLHESTVSRATADKYVMLPTGRVTRFRDFFDPSLPAREELRHIIRDEERPLSDAQLTRRMGERGYHLARRTVTKYRHRLQVPPGALR